MSDNEKLSALPGEVEVRAYEYELATRVLGGVTGEKAYASFEKRVTDFAPQVPEGSIRNLMPLVTLASLQAMQARAEKAERERDEALAKNAVLNADGIAARKAAASNYARAEAAEARVKELEGAEARALVIIQPFADAADNLEDSVTGRSPIWETPAAMAIEAVDLRMAKQFYAARTALKGGSNG